MRGMWPHAALCPISCSGTPSMHCCCFQCVCLDDGYPDHTENDIEPLLFALGVLPIPHSILLVVPVSSGRRVHASPAY